MKKYDEAIEMLDKACELNPNEPANFIIKGKVLIELERYYDALESI